MHSEAYRRTTCRLCGSADLELVMPFMPSAIADDYVTPKRLEEKQNAYPMDVYLCRSCKHTQLLDTVNPELLFRNYTYVTSVSLGLVNHFKAVASHLIQTLSPAPNSLVVEIGSNDGTLLKNFKQQGLRVIGIDPAVEIAQRSTQAGIPTLPEFFTSALATQIRADHGPAALFIANNVFAHADNLGDIAEGIRALLQPDGVFVFEVSYMVDIVGKMIWDTIFHEHLCFHAVHPLVNFFQLHGMELFHVERIPTKGGSIRGYAQLRGGPRALSPEVGRLLDLENQLQFGTPEPFLKCAQQIDKNKKELHRLISQIRQQGKTVAGYGASATVTTLIHQYELGDKLDFIVDDNPIKQGTFSPGHHIPVLAPSALLERKPDYVIILAWIYAEPIIQKNQQFMAGGGRFVIPNPEVKSL